MSARILVLPGTLQSASPNHALAFALARFLATTSATVTVLSLGDYPLPLLDADDEPDAIPEAALRLAEQLDAQDALLLVSPGAHDGVPPLVKNAVDWIARVRRLRGRPVHPFRGLVVGLASASPGHGGGFKVLDGWRAVFVSLGAEVMTAQATLAPDPDSFDPDGFPQNAETAGMLEAFSNTLAERAQLLGRHQP